MCGNSSNVCDVVEFRPRPHLAFVRRKKVGGKKEKKKRLGEKKRGEKKTKKKKAIRSFTGIGEKCLLELWSVMNKSS